MSLDSNIEAVLFYKTEPYAIAHLADFFEVPETEVREALSILATRLSTGGVRLLMTDTTVQLVTAPEKSELIERLKKDELSQDIGKAGAETLAIILYRGPLSRLEVDRIRGVNSTFIIRNLLVRGLIERREHPTDNRSFTYAPTAELFAHLGILKREELPDFESVVNAIESFETEQKRDETGAPSLV
jgi:segregation and condensation protein B